MENVINYDVLEVDKENEVVRYNDQLHKYWTKSSNQSCISVTTLIHNFTTFDESFWSSYKAFESLLGVDGFKIYKNKLLDSKIFNKQCLEQANISEEIFNSKRQEILDEWAVKRDASCVRGTAIHREHELGHLDGETPELKQLGLGGKFTTNVTNKIELGSQNVYPELLISWISADGKLRLAGQADLIIIDGNDLIVVDYKTNKSIDMKAFFDKKTKKSQTMKYPLNDLQDTNFWHYTMQLSTYAWMIKKAFPGINIKKLMLIHYDHDGNCTPYDCEYHEAHVERMLSYYKKELEHDEFKKSREKIIF